jgi:NADPH:quinone reductase-like Zn-dependent oxidoreductase
VDLAINVAGGDTLEPTVKAIRPGGRMVLVGARDAALSPLSARFMMRGLGISVSRVGSREHFEQMNRAIEGARLKPVIARVFPFDQAREAFDYFATARHVGKIVIQH